MKKLLPIIFILVIAMVIILNSSKKDNKQEIKELRAIYISYIEISKYLQDKEEKYSKQNIDQMIANIKSINCNTIILQVRPSSDSIYNSKLFPVSKYLSSTSSYSYDVLDYFIKRAHDNNMKLYAWINPYRVSTTSNVEEITRNNPAFKYLNTDTIYINNGIFYNPSKEEVTNLIVDGVNEVLNYNIDGVLFDDYFYPSNDIDVNDYEEYLKNHEFLSIEDYHLNIVNNMIKQVHETCKRKNKLFGISPEGNIDNNYNKNFADIKKWLSGDEYVDFIMPQIYYGFYNSNKPFINTVNEWNNLITNKNINLYIALAFYKVGEEDTYAKEGKDEWIANDNIIMKEILYSRNISKYSGFSLYRYDNIFSEDLYKSTSKVEINNLKEILK